MRKYLVMLLTASMVLSMATAAFAGEGAEEEIVKPVSFQANPDEGFSYRACEHRDAYLLQDDSFEATDTEGGYRHYVCSECGAEYSYETAPMIYSVNPKTGEPVDQQGGKNPLFANWDFVADGEPHVFWSRPDEEWRVYVYGSHDVDGETMCGFDQVLWSAPVYDMSDWRYEGVVLDFTQDPELPKLYAPDCDYDVTTDTYLMIANQANPDNRMVIRAADNPTGPWAVDEEVFDLRMRLAYDPAIYVENGTVYVIGTAYKAGVKDEGRQDILDAFDADNYKIKHTLSITKLKGSLHDGYELDETKLPASDEKCYMALYEGPSFGGWIDEIGAYVILYVANEVTEEGETLNSAYSYIYSDDIMGDVWHYGDNGVDDIVEYNGDETISGNHGNVTYDTSGRYHRNPETGLMEFENIPTSLHGNNHGGICRINGVWYQFGHSPSGNGGASRRAVADIMHIGLNEDGTPLIEPVEFTSSGVSEYLDAYKIWGANTACYLTAGIGIPAAHGGEGQVTEEGFDQPYIVASRDREASHTSYITDIKNGSIAGFKYIGFGDEEKTVKLKMLINRTEDMTDGRVNVYIDGPSEEKYGKLIGTVEINSDIYAAGEAAEDNSNAADGNEWYWISGEMTEPVSGVHAVYLVFESDGGYIMNFDQFTFE